MRKGAGLACGVLCAALLPAATEITKGHWHVLGPFEWVKEPRKFWGDRPLPPDASLDLTATYQGRTGPVRWREVPAWDTDGVVYEIAEKLGAGEQEGCVAAYLYRKIDAPADTDAILYLGFDDGLVLRLNGTVIFQRFFYRSTEPRQEAIPVRLVKGRNDFLLKIVDKDNTSASAFCFDLRLAPPPPSAEPGSRTRGVGEVTGSSIEGGDRAVFKTARGTLSVAFWRDTAPRVTFVPANVSWPYPPAQRPLPASPRLRPEGAVPGIGVEPDRFIVRGRSLNVEVLKNGAAVIFSTARARRVVEIGMRTEPERTVEEIKVHLQTREGVFGTGSRYDAFNRRGRRNAIGNCDRAFGESHFTLPHFITQGRDAFFINSFGDGEISIDRPEAENIAVCRLEESVLDFFYFAGDPKSLIRQYVDLTGHTVMPPAWTLGVWMSRNSYEDEGVVLDVAKNLRKHNVPASVLVLEAWREDGADWMSWNPARWKNHETMCATLHQMGFRVVIWTMQFHSYNCANPLPYEREALENRYFVMEGDKPWGWDAGTPRNSYIVDFFNPAACAWWERQYRPLFHPATGIDGLKTDIGENNGGVTSQGWKDINNIYALGYLRCAWEMTKRITGEGMIFARTGTVGTQQYPILWAGDHSTWFQGMQEAYNAMMSVGLSGYAWTTFDIGGLYGDLDKETYVRMAQMGAFCPIMQAHGQGRREPFDFGDYGEEAVEIFNRYARWYLDLTPYRIAAGREACETGVPIMRPLWLEYPDDPACYDAEFEYLFGPDILVAPIFSYNHTRDVYLPAGECGEWIDWWTGERVRGGRTLRVEMPLERMPIYVRPGADVVKFSPGTK
jgi:alpha-glucosidase (family GH31 glycosyl hydrolase)